MTMKIITKLKDLKEKISKVLNDKVSNYVYECVNCGKKYDGTHVEKFIQHQIDYQHFESTKYRKESVN